MDGEKPRGLRISVTKRCNLECPYCHREGILDDGPEISLEKILSIVEAAKTLGIENVKITGGEPLLRDEIIDIVSGISGMGISDISLTTNGLLLDKYANHLHKAGLDRVNIGCDSLSSTVLMKNMTSIKEGLDAAFESGLSPIKLNMVVLAGLNEHEIEDMIEFTGNKGIILQLIELIDTDDQYYKEHYYSLDKIEERLNARAVDVKKRGMHNRMQYNLGDAVVEVVRPLKKGFCDGCMRLRVTSDGKLKPCLFKNDNLVEFNGVESICKAIGLREAYG